MRIYFESVFHFDLLHMRKSNVGGGGISLISMPEKIMEFSIFHELQRLAQKHVILQYYIYKIK